MNDRPGDTAIDPNGLSSAAKQAQRGSVLREKAQQARTISPLSYNQRGLWTIHQNNPDGAAYHVAFAAHIVSHIRVPALRKAFQSIADRHPALRTTFTLENGEPVQVIHAAQEVAFEERAVDGKTVDAEVRRDYERPFDLEAGPLMRVTLFRIEPQRSVLLVNIHHLVFDGWSLWILLSELGELYEAARGEGELPPQQIRHTYVDFVRWQADLLESERGQQLWNFWRERLSDELPVLDLPTDHPRRIMQATRGSTHLFDLSSGLTDEWKRFSRQESSTPFHTLLAAWSVLLYRYTGQTDIVVGVPMTGTARGLDAFQQVAGCFVNTVPVRIDLSGNPGFRVLLARVRSALLGALEHQDYPFPLLVERLKIARDHGRSPVFQVAMIYQKPQADNWLMDLLVHSAAQRRVNLGGMLLEPYQLAQQEGQFDITLEVMEYEGLVCALKYDRDLFEPATIERLAQHYRTLLESILEDAGKPIGELAILPAQELVALLADVHLTADDSQREQCMHQTYEARAARVPKEIALVCGKREITFGDLNARANGLARRLESLGVRPDVPVGICASRSIEMVTGMLAILKAGGAYVPLDPSFPEDRLAWMIEDSGIRVVLTESALQQQVQDCGASIVLLGEHTCGEQLDTDVRPCHLAYVIYTSGSTGRPKGVMVEHRQVSNFFSAMDARLEPGPPATFLAITTISFDISVLEIFWALTRGFKVVLQGDASDYFSKTSEMAAKPLEFSLFYFANEGAGAARDRYRLLLEGAKFADVHGFSAVWTPERHFHSFGGPYPNPSVAGAALAAATERIHIRAGSVVLPLHSPIRVAEEWSVVDNLSDGRVGLSFASGWNSNDFVLAPQNYEHRKLALTKGVETVRRLWRGETIEFPDHQGNAIAVQTLPRPIQAELPFWLTSAGDPETIQNAGRIGANLLTHLLGQSFEQLEKSIALYRQARREAGHPGDGHVTLMLHTFVGADLDAVRETVRKPFCDYLRSSSGLMSNMARSAGHRRDAGSIQRGRLGCPFVACVRSIFRYQWIVRYTS
ncbi:MupA/Atu3671 family FMN-dependent luciferase-like monooxygenase [Paraburkholderia sp. RL17-337-BIB-A]|uniref:MupA/Atu3671 family FMN-dependent luciferase-like monooxygenase n=1 Tax=Paraburkholderia sp. RL17-337-BIB-A TaxID=3031636 RepID=UPI0038B71A2E